MKEDLSPPSQDKQTAEIACDTLLKKLKELDFPLKVGWVNAAGKAITQERFQQLREDIIQAGMIALEENRESS